MENNANLKQYIKCKPALGKTVWYIIDLQSTQTQS